MFKIVQQPERRTRRLRSVAGDVATLGEHGIGHSILCQIGVEIASSACFESIETGLQSQQRCRRQSMNTATFVNHTYFRMNPTRHGQSLMPTWSEISKRK